MWEVCNLSLCGSVGLVTVWECVTCHCMGVCPDLSLIWECGDTVTVWKCVTCHCVEGRCGTCHVGRCGSHVKVTCHCVEVWDLSLCGSV